ncbi:MAG: SRPBCC domain-containing protein [Acidobacteriota bacterium]|jgi:uncharacterized protein YndB with AHSA1/START domain
MSAGTEIVEHRSGTVRARKSVECEPERAWNAWTDPRLLAQWFTDDARGEARVGETLTWIWKDFDLEIPQQVLVAEAGERLVLEGPAPGAGRQLLEVRFRAEGGHTLVDVINSGFPEAEEFRSIVRDAESGWHLALAVFKQYVEAHLGSDCRRFFVQRSVPFEFEDLVPFYRREAELARWLTRSGEIGDEAEPYRLELRDGRSMHGRVLARSEREVALSWDELGGVVELKAFAAGAEARVIATRATLWAADAEQARAAESLFTESLERLATALRDGAASG